MIMNGNNQAKCPYCNKFCKKVQGLCVGYGKYAKWQECPNCKTKFAVGPKCVLKGAKYKVTNPKEEDTYYVMEVNYKANSTWIYYGSRPNPKLTTSSTFVPGQYVITGGATGNMYHFTKTIGGEIKWMHTEKSIVKLEKAIKDITPENVYDKIKMYILFS